MLDVPEAQTRAGEQGLDQLADVLGHAQAGHLLSSFRQTKAWATAHAPTTTP